MKLPQISLREIFLLVALAATASTCVSDEGPELDDIILLKKGKNDLVTYRLHQAVVARDSEHAFVLMLRNKGAKSISLKSLRGTVQDKEGNDVKTFVQVSREAIAYDQSAVVVVSFWKSEGSQRWAPWTLRLNNQDQTFVPLELTISDIKPVVLD